MDWHHALLVFVLIYRMQDVNNSNDLQVKIHTGQFSVGTSPYTSGLKFHVEVARMFRDSKMPKKKEAAIAELQEWFLTTHGKSVSRAAVGQKLKPYFDTLQIKDRKS